MAYIHTMEHQTSILHLGLCLVDSSLYLAFRLLCGSLCFTCQLARLALRFASQFGRLATGLSLCDFLHAVLQFATDRLGCIDAINKLVAHGAVDGFRTIFDSLGSRSVKYKARRKCPGTLPGDDPRDQRDLTDNVLGEERHCGRLGVDGSGDFYRYERIDVWQEIIDLIAVVRN